MIDVSSPLPVPVATPQRIGKYRIVRQLAQGGMAEIYLATSTGIEGFEKLCVLKRILPLLAGNQEFVQMFLDEARIAASLLHSNIAQVFDIGEDQGSYYFVMEFLRGEDVRHILASSAKTRSFVPYEHMVTIITGTCSGLHYAHEVRGKDGSPLCLVHRDISPQNIFVTHDGSVKLCDFGIAKSAARLTETRVGTLKGKIRYMSPEQCQSEPLDRRSDVFALSVVMWELIALRRLFSGNSDFDVFKAICEAPIPRPSTFRGDVHAGLEAIVMKGLARNREERFQSAQEMQIALEDWSRAERVRTSPVRLAEFMAKLFPAIASDDYAKGITDADPLVQRIRALNENESSDSGLVPMPESMGQGPMSGSEDTAAATPQPLRVARMPEAATEPDEDSAIRPPPRRRGAAIALGLSSAFLVLALVSWKLSASPRVSPPDPQPSAPQVLAVSTPAVPPGKPSSEGVPVPAVPVPAAPEPIQAEPSGKPRSAATPRARPSRTVGKKLKTPPPHTRKTPGALDDFLPP